MQELFQNQSDARTTAEKSSVNPKRNARSLKRSKKSSRLSASKTSKSKKLTIG